MARFEPGVANHSETIVSTSPLPVEIVRPERTTPVVVGEWIARAIDLFTTALVLMLYIPLFAPWHPGYWQALGVAVTASVLFPRRPTLDAWTRKRSK